MVGALVDARDGEVSGGERVSGGEEGGDEDTDMSWMERMEDEAEDSPRPLL